MAEQLDLRAPGRRMRMARFFKDQGLMPKEAKESGVRFGQKGLEALERALKE